MAILYLALFGFEKYISFFNRIRYLVRVKNGNSYVVYHNYVKIKTDSDDDLPVQKTLNIVPCITSHTY